MNLEHKKTEIQPFSDGFWNQDRKENYAVGLHGDNEEFTQQIAKLFDFKGQITDIHLTEKKNVWIRLLGDMQQLDIVAPEGGISSFCSNVLRLPAYERANGSAEYKGQRLRLRFSQSMRHKQLFIRLLPGVPPGLKDIGHEKTFSYLNKEVKPGIIFIAGATGSGKSTLLASILQEYLNTLPIHLSTVEDPVEYLLFDKKGEVSQREIPDDTPDFATAVKDVLREDPDVILIGEIRDPDTAKTALTAAETGHMVFATIHASSVSGIIDRLLGMLMGINDAPLRLSQSFLGGFHLFLLRDAQGNVTRHTDVVWGTEEVKENILKLKLSNLQKYTQRISQ